VRFGFDQLGKQIGEEALGTSGPTVANDELSPDAQHADLRHDPDPTRGAERARLGLLGRLASVLCLIEIYSGAPDEDEALACLSKLIAFRQKRARDARRKRKKKGPLPDAPQRPFLWIIAAGRPNAVLDEGDYSAGAGWPPGVYFSPGLYRTGIIAASELPRDRSTLLVRLMAAGPLLPHAIEDLGALPTDAHERGVAEQILLRLEHALGKKPSRTPEEQEFVMTMQNTWEKAREIGWEQGREKGHKEGRKAGRVEGREQGREQGRAEEAARAVLTALRVRGVEVPDAARERILAEKDPKRLERWLERAIVAASIDDVLDGPS
jgi:hypothetical protein